MPYTTQVISDYEVFSPSTQYSMLSGSMVGSTAEDTVQTKIYDASKASNLYMRVTSNSLNGSTTLTFRINKADGSQSISIPAGTTGEFEDPTNIDSLAVGDLVNYKYIFGGTSGTIAYTITACLLYYESALVTILCARQAPTLGYGETVYICINGEEPEDWTVEADTQHAIRQAAPIDKLRTYVYSNTLDGSSTLALRRNGATTGLSVSVSAGATGSFEDATTVVQISPGDLVNYMISTGGTTGSIRFTIMQCRFITTKGFLFITGGHYGLGVATWYIQISGHYSWATTTESQAQLRVRKSILLFVNLFTRIRRNTYDGTSTLSIRRNGATGNLAISIPSGTTGNLTNISDYDFIRPSDLVNYTVTTAATTGGLSPQNIGLQAVYIGRRSIRQLRIGRGRATFLRTLSKGRM